MIVATVKITSVFRYFPTFVLPGIVVRGLLLSEFGMQALDGHFEGLSTADTLARIYTWLRYSAMRQLTWQRNYNTKPRELSASQEALCNAILRAYGETSQEAQEFARMMLTTVGRGGDGQKIRDEILNIMHRNKVKEVQVSCNQECSFTIAHPLTFPPSLSFLVCCSDSGGEVSHFGWCQYLLVVDFTVSLVQYLGF